MKRVNPFPSLSLLLPDDVVEEIDSTVASYWKRGDTCLLQLSSFLREQGPQVSAVQRLSERTGAGGRWETVDLPHAIEGCDMVGRRTGRCDSRCINSGRARRLGNRGHFFRTSRSGNFAGRKLCRKYTFVPERRGR